MNKMENLLTAGLARIEGVWTVTGQRSNQLNYVPPLFSPGCGNRFLLSFLTVHCSRLRQLFQTFKHRDCRPKIRKLDKVFWVLARAVVVQVEALVANALRLQSVRLEHHAQLGFPRDTGEFQRADESIGTTETFGKIRGTQVVDLAAPQGFEPRYADPESSQHRLFRCSSVFPEVYGKLRKFLSFLICYLSPSPLNSAR
jgi:hypothetical protein